MNLQVERLKRLPQKKNEIWQGGLLRAPAWIVEDGQKPFRPWMGGWISIKTRLINVSKPAEKKSFDLALNSLVDFACNTELAGYRPGGLDVKDADVAEYLGELLEGADIVVEQRNKLHTFDELLELMLVAVNDHDKVPNALDHKKVTVEHMRSFAEAACEFYRAKPWRYLSGEDLIEIESPAGDPGTKYATVLGAAGDTYGLGFYGSRDEFDSLFSENIEENFGNFGRWAVFFSPIMELPFGDADLWEDHHLAVGGTKGYPLAACFGPGNKVRRPGPDMLEFMEGLMHAIALSTEEEVDSGQWKKVVSTTYGQEEYLLSLPDLLNSKPDKARNNVGSMADRMQMEGTMKDIHRLLEEQDFESEQDIQEFINANLIGKKVAHHAGDTPLEQAQELAYQAYDALGRKQVQLARKAIEICPDCCDAYLILAESCSDHEDALPYYKQAIDAGQRVLGEEVFKEDAGHFWGILETRPYMRARFGLATCLQGMGKLEEAAEHYRQLLNLNPNDNQGVRDILLQLLIVLSEDEEAQNLWKRYNSDKFLAVWSYSKALLTFRSQRNTATARKHLKKAIEVNGYVPDYLLGNEPMPINEPQTYSMGSKEEAIFCYTVIQTAWQMTEGALDWLEENLN